MAIVSNKMLAKKIGALGEAIALKYLLLHGYQHIGSNFTIRGGEVDLIMRKDGILVFVEVKTRSSLQFGSGLEAITPQKKRLLLKTSRQFLEKYQEVFSDWQIDSVVIMLSNSGARAKVQHHKNIFSE